MCENIHFEFFRGNTFEITRQRYCLEGFISYLLFPGPNTPELQALCPKAGSSAVDIARPKSQHGAPARGGK